jgi:hypothetical protein
MSNGVVLRENDLPVIADDYLIQVADQAERRIDAVIKIKQVALKVTNARDWTDQQGNPYLQVSGSEKIANLFNISWRIEEPKCEEEPDGHFTYSIKGEFSLGGRTIEVEGTRSSKDPFFNRYDYSKPKDPETKKHPTLPPSSIDKGDVKKAALTNLYGNGITRLLGIRNLTWEDLEKFAGITQKMIEGKVSYNQRETGMKAPESKSARPSDAAGGTEVIGEVSNVMQKSGGTKEKPWTKYSIFIGETAYNTFDKTIAENAKAAKEVNAPVKITYTVKEKYGNEIETLVLYEEEAAPEPVNA